MSWNAVKRQAEAIPADQTLAIACDVTVAGDLSVGGTTIVGGEINDDVSLITGKTFDIVDADALTENDVIVPQFVDLVFQWSIATQMVSSSLFIAPRAMQVVGCECVYGVQAGQACKLLLEKATGTTAPGSGTALLTNNTNTGFDINTTANTVQTGTLTATEADLQLAAGDRLSAKWGTSTSCVGCVLTVRLKYI